MSLVKIIFLILLITLSIQVIQCEEEEKFSKEDLEIIKNMEFLMTIDLLDDENYKDFMEETDDNEASNRGRIREIKRC